METQLAKPDAAAQIMERVLLAGDLQRLQPADRVRYYNEVCTSVGLNPLTQPFEYITLNGKLTLYAKKSATDQLRSIHGVSITIADRETREGIYIVSARATNTAGRTDEDVGAVTVGNLKGDALCNAMMKAETKAKRRVTLSICGLGMLDETEVETIPNAQTVKIEQVHDEQPAPMEKKAQPSKPPQPESKGQAYADMFLDLLDLALLSRDLGTETKPALVRAMAQLKKQHDMDENTVTPEVGERLIAAIKAGKFDKAPAAKAKPQQEAA